jgi:hypothetical protein
VIDKHKLRPVEGLRKRPLSNFRESAEKWRTFDEMVKQARKAFASVPAAELDRIIEEAVSSARKQKRQKTNRHSRQ